MPQPLPEAPVLAALADPTRWRVLDLIAERGEASASAIAADVPVSRPAVVKHLGVLDRAGLVESRRAGREVRYRVRPAPLDAAAGRLARIASEWDERLERLRRLAEGGGSEIAGDGAGSS